MIGCNLKILFSFFVLFNGWQLSLRVVRNLIKILWISSFSSFLFRGEYKLSEDLKRTAPKVTIPEPEMTSENKFKCPIDQQVYDNRQDYEAHCKEEHDVL